MDDELKTIVDEEFQTIEELKDRLKVPKSWIYSRTRLRGPEGLPAVRVGKYLRFRLSDVMAWLEKQNEDG